MVGFDMEKYTVDDLIKCLSLDEFCSDVSILKDYELAWTSLCFIVLSKRFSGVISPDLAWTAILSYKSILIGGVLYGKGK